MKLFPKLTWFVAMLTAVAHWGYTGGLLAFQRSFIENREVNWWDPWIVRQLANPDVAVWIAAVGILLVPLGVNLLVRNRYSNGRLPVVYLSSFAVALLLYYVSYWWLLGARDWSVCRCGFAVHAPYATHVDMMSSLVLTAALALNLPINGGSWLATLFPGSGDTSRLSALARPGVYS